MTKEVIFGGCRSCHINCGAACTVEDGRLVRVDGIGPERHGFGKMCLRGMAGPQFEHSPTRVKYRKR